MSFNHCLLCVVIWRISPNARSAKQKVKERRKIKIKVSTKYSLFIIFNKTYIKGELFSNMSKQGTDHQIHTDKYHAQAHNNPVRSFHDTRHSAGNFMLCKGHLSIWHEIKPYKMEPFFICLTLREPHAFPSSGMESLNAILGINRQGAPYPLTGGWTERLTRVLMNELFSCCLWWFILQSSSAQIVCF